MDEKYKTQGKINIKKVVLVNPPIRSEQVYGVFSDWKSVNPPTALCYIAAVLRKNNYEVSIIDAEATGLGIEETVSAIIKEEPQIIGIACKILWIVNAHRVARALKERIPEVPIVAGGNQVSAIPERTFKEFPAFDILVIGEGEITFLELIKSLNEGKELSGVKGIAFRQNGAVCKTAPRERILNLDELPPPAFDLLPELTTYYRPPLNTIKKLPAFSLVTSRGCPFQCAFCDRSVFGQLVISHSPEYIIEMIKELYHRYGIRYLSFDDDILLLNKKYLFAFLELLKKSNLKIQFFCQSRVDTIDKEMLIKLKEAGCRTIAFGIESGSQKMLDAMKKGITVDQIKKAISLTKRIGIETLGYFIVGYPGETEETLKDTIKLIKECDFDDVSPFFFTPLPGSEVYADVEKYGAYNEDWEKTNSLDQIVFVSNGLTEEKLRQYANLYFNACYLRASQILHLYRRFSSIAHSKAVAKTLIKTVFGGGMQ